MEQVANSTSQTFGKYELIQELGRGGFGIVYKAIDRDLNRMVAVKLLHPALVVSSDFVSRFKKEAQTAAQLDHPNLVQVYDYGQIDGRYYFSMTYMAGGSLKDKLIQQGPFPLDQAIKTFMEIAAGLQFCHQKGIIHRDIKPGNILFDESGFARISDLGFAKASQNASSLSLSSTGALIGTPAYMAPEIWRGIEASPQTDIYAMGCILYEMLTGKPLFDGGTPPELMTMHLMDGARFRAPVPEMIKPVLLRALAMDPSHRFKTVAEFSHAVQANLTQKQEVFPPKPIPTSATAPDQPNYQAMPQISPPRQTVQQPAAMPIAHHPSPPVRETPKPTVKRWVPYLIILALIPLLIFAVRSRIAKSRTADPGNTNQTSSDSSTQNSLGSQSYPTQGLFAGTPTPTDRSPISEESLGLHERVDIGLIESFGIEKVAEFSQRKMLGWSDDEQLFALGNGTDVEFFDGSSLNQLSSFNLLELVQEGPADANSATFSRDGKLAAVRATFQVFVFELDGWNFLKTIDTGVGKDDETTEFLGRSHYLATQNTVDVIIKDATTDTSLGPIQIVWTGRLSADAHFLLSPDGRKVVTYSSENGGVLAVWDPFNNQKLFEKSEIGWFNVAVTPDSGSLVLGFPPGQMEVWDITTGNRTSSFSLEGYLSSSIRQIDFFSQDRLLIQFWDEEIALLVNPIEGTIVNKLDFPGVNWWNFSKNGNYAWDTWSNTLRVWKLDWH